MPIAKSATCKAEVPELTAILYLNLKILLNLFSNCSTNLPAEETKFLLTHCFK